MGSRREGSRQADIAATERGQEASDAVISARGLRKSYGSGAQEVEVLRGIDLDIPRGQMVGVVGPSGSGKSTLLHVLSGLDDLSSGEVVFDGRRLADSSDSELARLRATSIGFVLQQNNFMPSLTIEENVAAPLILAGERRAVALQKARDLLGDVGVADRVRAWPGEVSVGQLQRAAVARACVGDPLVVFADEPTGALDSENRNVVVGLLQKVTKGVGAAAVVVTHDPVVAAACDRVLRMSDGTLEELDEDDALAGSPA